MVSFTCGNCGKLYEFKLLPIPDEGAQFQCADCGKTCRLNNINGHVVCEVENDPETSHSSSTLEMDDSFRSALDDEISPDELESRLQGLYPDMPFDVDILLGVVEGPDKGLTVPIKVPILTIGRSGCDIILNDGEISQEHCQIEIYGNQMTILRDCQSTGGTYRNGFPTTLTCLRPGDRILIGKTTLLYLQNPKRT